MPYLAALETSYQKKEHCNFSMIMGRTGLTFQYIEKKLRKSINQWKIEDCNTPTYSPQSNGMCEAFNGTFKRDYVYESCLDNAKTVHDQIQKWVDEYNQFAPHSALDMKTPNEYYNFKSAA
jgi:putative transposase